MKTFQILSPCGSTLALVEASYPEDALEQYAQETGNAHSWADCQSWDDLARICGYASKWELDPDGIHILIQTNSN